MDPSSTAALAVRTQTLRPRSAVRRASAGCSIKVSVFRMRPSEIRLRNGDCPSCTARPWRRVSSNTGSPVVLVKSASTIVSSSVSRGVRRRPRTRGASIAAAGARRPESRSCFSLWRSARISDGLQDLTDERRSSDPDGNLVGRLVGELRFTRIKVEPFD
jgi:hypothetical protein